MSKDQISKDLDYINEHHSITQREYGDISTRSLAARKQDFERLLNLGMIKAKGNGRGTYYISQPPEKLGNLFS